jgi:hypothetical protein
LFFLVLFSLCFSFFSWKEKDIDNGINGSIWHVYAAGRDFAQASNSKIAALICATEISKRQLANKGAAEILYFFKLCNYRKHHTEFSLLLLFVLWI